MKKIFALIAVLLILISGGSYLAFAGDSRNYGIDNLKVEEQTDASVAILYPHHKKHDGKDYFLTYSVASLGAMETPTDMITLTWTTPNTTSWEHFVVRVLGTGGWRLRLIEAPSGGAENATEQFVVLNSNRNYPNASGSIALDSTAGEMSYDATLATGGVTLWDEYIAGDKFQAGQISHEEEVVLKQNTKYQVSLYGVDTDVATMHIGFYNHRLKN